MSAVFDFTDRATPVIQFGRAQEPIGDAYWGSGIWGEGHWGKIDWAPSEWLDLTCEIHDVTTNTGRGNASDRFVPGTANIVASNMKGISDAIFPHVPTGPLEFVPQPPIENEEQLGTPDAGTVRSNGWSFTDDFHTVGPRWVFPQGWVDSTLGIAPCGPFKIMTEAFEPELYLNDTTAVYEGCSAAQWTHFYENMGNTGIEIVLTGFDWPSSASIAGTPELRVDLFARSNTVDRDCQMVRFRFVPVWGGANQVFMEFWRMGPTGTKIAGTTSTALTTGTGTNGVFGTRTLSLNVGQFFIEGEPTGDTVLSSSLSGVFSNLGWTDTSTPPTGGRIGIWVHYSRGRNNSWPVCEGGPRITLITGPDFVDDISRPLGSGWTLPAVQRENGHDPMRQFDGAMVPDESFLDQWGGNYSSSGYAQWTSSFDGDQFIEATISNLAMDPVHPPAGFGDSVLELYAHGNNQDLSCMGAYVEYDANINGGDNIIYWQVFQIGKWGEQIALLAEGEINLGPIEGAFPQPERWRLESDLNGEQRLYRNGKILATAVATTPAQGDRIAVFADSIRGMPDWPDANPAVRRTGTVHLDSVSGGLQQPLGTEALGMWIRIGVHHETLGTHWLFRGVIDAVVPTYVPDRPDAARIECVDTLGEAGRSYILRDQIPYQFAAASNRIDTILNNAQWPHKLRRVFEDNTITSRPGDGKAVDALTAVAESCGGAVYGDPETGDVVFKGMDWQGVAASGPVVANITNFRPELEPGDVPRICPVEWERSSRRQDMLTRVRYRTETSQFEDGRPIIKEWRSPQAEAVYGVEKLERTLLTTTAERLNELCFRQLRLRSPNQFPRVEAVTLDAATGDESLDFQTTATFVIPTKVRCQLRRLGEFVFNRNYLVTGVQHRMSPDRWTTRLALDISSAFYEPGGRWGTARWDVDEWGVSR